MFSQFFCGVDLAEDHFSVHAVDDRGKVILHKSVSRAKLLTTLANMPAMRIGIEACSGAHYWARTFIKLGYDARIMAAKYVGPYRTKARMTSMMPSLSAKQFSAPTRDLFPLNPLNDKRFWPFTE